MATAVVPDIAVLNESSVVTDDQIRTWTAAVQRQLDEHVLPYWGVTAKLHPLPQGTPRPSGAWWMLVTDNSDMANALGYHDLGNQGQPLGKVFAKTTNSMGWGDLESPSRVLSHETIELIVDPFMVRIIDLPDAEYLVEPGDPVFLPTQGYRIDGVLVSDWATPAYYHYNADRRYDHEGYLSAPCPAMIHGSYLMYRSGSTGPWLNKQMLEGAPGPELDRLRYLMRPRSGSRRYRRMIGRDNWVLSTSEAPRDFGDLVARVTPKAGVPALPLITAGIDTFPSGTWNLEPISVQWNLKQENEVDVKVSILGMKIDTLTGVLSAAGTTLQAEVNVMGIITGRLGIELKYSARPGIRSLNIFGQLIGAHVSTGPINSIIASW